ncbi:MAG: hypothetical protein KDC46_05515 [Thermoleophilia bacterium]|nr:hypothetical protein [Thermoleophilia bacterium]
MHLPSVTAATSLRQVGERLEVAASLLDEAHAIDAGYRFRPWGMRGSVHERLRAATVEFERAGAAFPGSEAGFGDARSAVDALRGSSSPEAIANRGPSSNPAAYRREGMRELARTARGWADVAREGARLLEDPATSPESIRRDAIARAGALVMPDSELPWRELPRDAPDFLRLAAIDELPAGLRPDLPRPLARAYATQHGDPYAHAGLLAPLGSWARRELLLEQPGFDRAAAVEALARALDDPDPQAALRQVAAIDQLPGHVRPDLPHVANDWNWTTVQEHRNPGRHEAAVAALRGRIDDLRAAARLEAAPPATVDEAAAVVGTHGNGADMAALRRLRDLPGFPPSLVAAEGKLTAFDVVRTRTWVDAQRLAASDGASRALMVEHLRNAVAVLDEPASRTVGGAGSGADLANHLEGARGLTPTGDPHDALVRIAAIDSLPSELRPDMPSLVGVGSRLDAAAHQSPRAFDHQADLLRLQAWVERQPRAATITPAEPVERSALRRFLDPESLDDAAALPRTEQAAVLADVLGAGGSYTPREVHGALVAARRYLADTDVSDPHVRGLAQDAVDLVDRNVTRTSGGGNDGFGVHPEYAELGRVSSAIRLLDRFEGLRAAGPKPSAAGEELLSW